MALDVSLSLSTYIVTLQKPGSRESLIDKVLSICNSLHQSPVIYQRHRLAGRNLDLSRVYRVGRDWDRRLYISAADTSLGTIRITYYRKTNGVWLRSFYTYGSSCDMGHFEKYHNTLLCASSALMSIFIQVSFVSMAQWNSEYT